MRTAWRRSLHRATCYEAEIKHKQLLQDLQFAAEAYQWQLGNNSDLRWLDHTIKQLASFSRWVKSIRDHENRRTMPITNSAVMTPLPGKTLTNPQLAGPE